jgi:MFS family permease
MPSRAKPSTRARCASSTKPAEVMPETRRSRSSKLASARTTFVVLAAAAAAFGSKTQLIWGSALTALSCVLFALVNDDRWVASGAGAIFGLALGLVYSSMVNLIVQSVPAHQTGVASGMNTNIRTIGASIGTAVVSSIVTAHVQPSGYPAESGYTTSFVLLAIISLAATAAAFLVPAARREPAVRPSRRSGETLEELSPVEV